MTKWKACVVGSSAVACHVVFFDASTAVVLGARSLVERGRWAAKFAAFHASKVEWLDVLPVRESESRIVLVRVPDARGGVERRWAAAAKSLEAALRTLQVDRVQLPPSTTLGAPAAFESLVKSLIVHSFRPVPEAARDTAEGLRFLSVSAEDLGFAQETQALLEPRLRAIAWVEQPANLLTPAVFAEEAAAALREHAVQVDVLDLEAIEKIGAGALLAVGRGSVHEPRLLVARWRGDPDRDEWDCAWVGKGLTFDGGGLNLKSAPVIEKMKFDMGGAAAVIGALELAARRKAKANLVAVVPMAENAIGSKAFRPGDVIRALSGQTIEVLNTDAEGRLVIADAITYAIRHFGPSAIIDLATLTGMVTGVLHEEFAGLYTSDDDLASSLLAAGEATDEKLWRLPLVPEQDYLVDSKVADVCNLGNPGFLGVAAGSPTAGAKFIERFARGQHWAHIDIAGTAWRTRAVDASRAGATGFGVALLDRWVTHEFGDC